MFISRIYKYIRRRFFGGITKRYISYVLFDMINTRGDDFVRQMLSERSDDPVWMDWLARLVDVKDAARRATQLAEELQELSFTTAQRGKILGEFAAKLGNQQKDDDTETPSPFSHEVSAYTLFL